MINSIGFDFEKGSYTCCICEEQNKGRGNNPEPLMDNYDGSLECCERCNEKVITYRLRQIMTEIYNDI
jgi:hypothetical protein